jgi:hypothetical protein
MGMQSKKVTYFRTFASIGCVVLWLAGTTTAFGQGFQGGLRGAVRDPGGALIPGVEVSLINEGTNVARNTVSNEVGEFVFSFVAPGAYRLKASLAGFKTFERAGINIGTQQFITLDISLELGARTEEIRVTADVPLVETSTASTGGALPSILLEELPTVARNPFMLALTVPNVIHTGNPFYVRMQDQTNSSLLSLGGGPIRGNNYLLDGVPETDLRNRAIFVPNIDSVAEIKVQVNTYDAEMGRTGGGVFNTTLKSGGNQFHGHGHIQQRPSQWAANDFFSNRAGVPKQDFFYWLWGGSFGGPIKRDKTFFWATHEGYHTGTNWTRSLTVPTELQKKGDFSQTFDDQGRLVVIYDPLTTRPDPANPGRFIRDPFPGNKIPDNRINAVGKAIMGFYPAPRSAGDIAGRDNFFGRDVLLDNTWQETGKVDHTFNTKHNLSGNFTHYRSREPFPVYFRGTPGEIADVGNSVLFRDTYMPIVNYTMTPNATSVLNLRYGYYNWRDSDFPASAGFDLSKLGYASGFVGAAPAKAFTGFDVEGYRELGTGPGTRLGANAADDSINWKSHNFIGGYSKFIGRHSFKFGGAYREVGVDFTDRNGSAGYFNITKAFTQRDPFRGESNAGNAIASLLLGYAESGNILAANQLRFVTRYYAGYIHDDFRVRSNFTVNLGLRYEYETDLKERDNQITVGFDRNAPNPLASKVTDPALRDRIRGGLLFAGVGGNKTHQGDPQLAKFQPRLGFAWTVSPGTVLRGGYGIFYAPLPAVPVSATAYGAPGFAATTEFFASADGGLTPADPNGITNPFPQGLRKPSGSSLGLLTNVGGNVDFVDQNNKQGRVQQYSLDIQRELPSGVALTVGYIGSWSNNISINGTSNAARLNINQLPLENLRLGSALLEAVPNPFFGIREAGELSLSQTIPRAQLLRPFPEFQTVGAVRKSDGIGRYNALTVKAERRMDRVGIAFRASYTWSKMLDNYYGEFNTFTARTAKPLDSYNLGREYSYSIFDITHRVVVAPVWDLPFGRGKRLASSGFAEKIFGGWNVTPVFQVQSGFPASVWQRSNNIAGVAAGLMSTAVGQQRPNRVAGVSPCTSGRPQDRLTNWFNPAAFTQAEPFTLGNAPRRMGDCRGPGWTNLDVSVTKTVGVTESTRASFRVEFLDATNTPRFDTPTSDLGNSQFGRITATQGFARIIQWTLRYEF